MPVYNISTSTNSTSTNLNQSKTNSNKFKMNPELNERNRSFVSNLTFHISQFEGVKLFNSGNDKILKGLIKIRLFLNDDKMHFELNLNEEGYRSILRTSSHLGEKLTSDEISATLNFLKNNNCDSIFSNSEYKNNFSEKSSELPSFRETEFQKKLREMNEKKSASSAPLPASSAPLPASSAPPPTSSAPLPTSIVLTPIEVVETETKELTKEEFLLKEKDLIRKILKKSTQLHKKITVKRNVIDEIELKSLTKKEIIQLKKQFESELNEIIFNLDEYKNFIEQKVKLFNGDLPQIELIYKKKELVSLEKVAITSIAEAIKLIQQVLGTGPVVTMMIQIKELGRQIAKSLPKIDKYLAEIELK